MTEIYNLAKKIFDACDSGEIYKRHRKLFLEEFEPNNFNKYLETTVVTTIENTLDIFLFDRIVEELQVSFDFNKACISYNPNNKLEVFEIKEILEKALLTTSNQLNYAYKNQIYKITNKLNNQCYIGKSCNSSELRWVSHAKKGNTKISKAISDIGMENFIFEIIEIVKPPVDLLDIKSIDKFVIERERHYINEFDSIENGYNSRM